MRCSKVRLVVVKQFAQSLVAVHTGLLCILSFRAEQRKEPQTDIFPDKGLNVPIGSEQTLRRRSFKFRWSRCRQVSLRHPFRVAELPLQVYHFFSTMGIQGLTSGHEPGQELVVKRGAPPGRHGARCKTRCSNGVPNFTCSVGYFNVGIL